MIPAPSPWHTLARDPIVRTTAASLAVIAALYVFPVLDPAVFSRVAAYFLEAPLVLVILVALRYRLDRIVEPGERRFWNLLSVAVACWLSVELIDLLLGERAGDAPGAEILRALLYVAFYLFLVVALEQRPHLDARRAGSSLLRRLELAGAMVFVLGLLVYFALLPAVIDTGEYWSSSQLLYVVLDAYLLVRLVRLRPSTPSPHWRAVYGWLALTVGLWMVTDTTEMLMWAGVVSWVDFGTPLDLLWHPATLTFVAAARVREHPFPMDAPPATREFAQPLWGGTLIGLAVAFPLLHAALSVSGTLAGPTRQGREIVVLLLVVVLGALTLAYQELIRGEVDRLDRERSAALAEIEHQAAHDHLTGLPNRRLFLEHLDLAIARARRSQTGFAVLFVDLDRFKEINDSLGHATGDRLLQVVGQRLRECIREEDSLARVGGDEFMVLAHGPQSPADATRVARTLLDATTTPVPLDGRELVVSASIGICLYPQDGGDPAELVKNADAAMYRAKESGRAGYQLFAPTMNAEAMHRLALEGELRRALDHDEIEVHYQPIVALPSGELHGCEALVRWRHPERGLLLPGEFLDVAETSGLIVALGERVLDVACRQAAAWATAGRSLHMSVNLSARQLRDPELVKRVRNLLDELGLPPERLELEVTEAAALHSEEQTAKTLAALRTLGVSVALDDFGTGYSSLSHLRRLPIDVVKVDRSFVKDVASGERSGAIAAAVIGLAGNLGLAVTAEGVETPDQLARLRELGCGRLQGYLLGRPAPAEALDVGKPAWLTGAAADE